MSHGDRHTKAGERRVIKDPIEYARQESFNAVKQYDRVLDLIDEVVRDGRPFKLRASTILTLHREAMNGLSDYAGTYRITNVKIGGSKHQPPAPHLVPGLMEELCDYVNDNWGGQSAIELCSYVMWRLNWIHPFEDGNGRTSRAVSYLVLCTKLGYRLPGVKTVPEQIAENKKPYYDALEAADEVLRRDNKLDISVLQNLLETYIAYQLEDAWKQIKANHNTELVERRFH